MSEIALAWQYGKPIVILKGLSGITKQLIGEALDDRRDDCILGADNPKSAVSAVISALKP